MKKAFSLVVLVVLCFHWANFDAYSSPRKGKDSKARKVLFIGDSITDGNWGNNNSGQPTEKRCHWDKNHIYGHGYMNLCASHYESKYPEKGYNFYNRGISGNTLTNLEKRWRKDVIDLKPDVVSILIGINDVNHHFRNNENREFDFVAWEQKYKSLLELCLKENPDIKFILCTPFVAAIGKMKENTNYSKQEECVRKCAEIVSKIAHEYNGIVIRFDHLFDDLLKDSKVDDTYWIWDGIHPTPAGHRRMADLWISLVDKSKLLK